MSSSAKHRCFIVLGLIITLGLIYLCLSKIDLKHFADSLRGLQLSFFFLGCFFTVLILLFSSLQFKIFLPPSAPIRIPKLFQIVSIFAMMVNLVPFWGGHALFIYLVGKREKVGVTPALSAMTLEQIADGVAKLFIFALVSVLLSLPIWMSNGIRALVVVVSCVYALVFYFAIRFRHLNQNKDFSPVAWKRLLHFAANWAYHLHALRSFWKTFVGFGLAIAMKLCEVMAVWMVQKSFGLDFSFPQALLMVAALCIATTLPLTPGRIGIFEATALLVYQSLGLDPSTALAVGVVIHVVHTLPFICVGYINSLRLGFTRKELLHAPE